MQNSLGNGLSPGGGGAYTVPLKRNVISHFTVVLGRVDHCSLCSHALIWGISGNLIKDLCGLGSVNSAFSVNCDKLEAGDTGPGVCIFWALVNQLPLFPI